MGVEVGLSGALVVAVALVGGEGGVDGEVLDVRLQDVHDVHLAGQLHQLRGRDTERLFSE